MVSDVTMAKDLQILNPNITKQDIIEEAAKLVDGWILPVKVKADASIGTTFATP
jgi:hypothetical protein